MAECLAAQPGRIRRFGAERILLLAGIVAFGLGAARQEWANRARATSQRLIPDWFDATVQIETPPGEAFEPVAGGGSSREAAYWSTTARILRIEGSPVRPIRVWAGGWGNPELARGQVLTARVRREESPPAAWPGAFSWERFLESRQAAARIRLVSYTLEAEGVAASRPRLGPWTRFRRLLDRIRADGIARTRTLFPGPAGEVTAAVLYGYRGGLPEEVRSHFRRVGIAHVLAISGLHVGLLAAIAWGALRVVVRDRRAVAALCLAVLLLYLALAGGRTAAARATIMAGIYLGGILLARRSDLLNALGGAAILLLARNPSAVADLGFQLSFTAVIFISCGFHEAARWIPHRNERPSTVDPGSGASGWWQGLRPHPGARRRFTDSLRALLLLSLSAWLGVAPLVAHAFHLVSPVGILINVAVLPLMSLVLAAGILAQTLAWLPEAIAAVAAGVLGLPAHVLLWIAETGEGVPLGWMTTPPPEAWAAGLYYAGFALLFTRSVFVRVQPAGRGWIAGAAALLILSGTGWMLVSVRPSGPPATPRVTLLPGPRGETAIVESPSGGIAVIGRLPRRGLDAARYLRYRRRPGPDLIVHVTAAPGPESIAALLESGSRPAVAWLPETAGSDSGRGESPDSRPRVPEAAWGWRRLSEGAEPLRMAVSRDREGALAWWAIRTETGPTVTVSDPLWPEQLAYRFGHGVPGTYADLLVLHVRGRLSAASLGRDGGGWIALAGGRIEGAATVNRERWGALVLEGTGPSRRLMGYDGTAWRTIRAGAPQKPDATTGDL